MNDGKDKDAGAVRTEAQAYSDAIMRVRELALELKDAVFDCGNKRVRLQRKMMSEPGAKIQGMDSGDIEVIEFDIASTYGKARDMHTKARALGMKYGERMPVNPTYDQEYAYLYEKKAEVELSAPARR